MSAAVLVRTLLRLAALVAACAIAASEEPRVFLLDADRLREVRGLVQSGDTQVATAGG